MMRKYIYRWFFLLFLYFYTTFRALKIGHKHTFNLTILVILSCHEHVIKLLSFVAVSHFFLLLLLFQHKAGCRFDMLNPGNLQFTKRYGLNSSFSVLAQWSVVVYVLVICSEVDGCLIAKLIAFPVYIIRILTIIQFYTIYHRHDRFIKLWKKMCWWLYYKCMYTDTILCLKFKHTMRNILHKN